MDLYSEFFFHNKFIEYPVHGGGGPPLWDLSSQIQQQLFLGGKIWSKKFVLRF